MNSAKHWVRGLSVLAPALALATPALADYNYSGVPGLADPSEPGSVLVWPKFVTGTVPVFAGTAGAFNAAKTVIELGAICPAAAAPCTDNQTIHVHLHWVCPGVQVGEEPSVCPETDFTVPITFGTSSAGKITFNPGSGTGTITGPSPSDYNGSTIVPIAPCPRGYLIGYAVDNEDRPVKFDGLIGDTVQRSWGTDLQSESAIAIQADPTLPNWESSNDLSAVSVISLDKNGGLIFDGGSKHYQMVTGQLQGDVAFVSATTAPYHDSALIFLTLDVKSGLNNDTTAVALDFYNYNEAQLSTEFTFTCWGQAELSSLDPNLTVENFGSQTLNGAAGPRHDKGMFISGQAIDADTGKQVTLLGLFQGSEGPAGGSANSTTSYTIRPGNNSVPIPTEFVPFE
jgi:hypothetical protein